MKALFILFFVLNIYADEIQRLDAIVKDITQLRIKYQKSQKELKVYKNRVEDLENQLEIAKSHLKPKEAKCIKAEENIFPALNIIHTKPTTYRVSKNTFIYNNINGKKIDEWEKGTSFTSTAKTEKFIKITGYFVNRQWTKANKTLWISIQDASKRDIK